MKLKADVDIEDPKAINKVATPRSNKVVMAKTRDIKRLSSLFIQWPKGLGEESGRCLDVARQRQLLC